MWDDGFEVVEDEGTEEGGCMRSVDGDIDRRGDGQG